jgi:hypothetical protein
VRISVFSLALGGLIAAASAANHPAQAQTYDPAYPVCLHTYGPFGNINCRYISMEACRFNATGRSAQCEINPYFQASTPASKQRRSRPR